jgi:hypothetical protein
MRNSKGEIIRYDPALSEEPYQEQAYATMEEEKSGEYVKFEDFEALEEALRNLLQVTDGVYSNSKELGLAEEAASKILRGQYE